MDIFHFFNELKTTYLLYSASLEQIFHVNENSNHHIITSQYFVISYTCHTYVVCCHGLFYPKNLSKFVEYLKCAWNASHHYLYTFHSFIFWKPWIFTNCILLKYFENCKFYQIFSSHNFHPSSDRKFDLPYVFLDDHKTILPLFVIQSSLAALNKFCPFANA